MRPTKTSCRARCSADGRRPTGALPAVRVGDDGRRCAACFAITRCPIAIGFIYQSWDAAAAADDFIGRVRDAGGGSRGSRPAGKTPIVSVILDGENAWEHYAGGGRPFLRALYRRLTDADDIRDRHHGRSGCGPGEAAAVVFPGSWINGDFYIWAGHRGRPSGVGAVGRGARGVGRAAPSVSAPTAATGRVEELLIAEGSDWFWWYGDDHSSDQDAEFDDLFRRHLRNAYTALGLIRPPSYSGRTSSTAPSVGAAGAMTKVDA